MPSIPSQTGVEQHFSGHSPWDGLERAHPVPPYPVLAEQQARTCWEPLSLLPCTKPAGAELFSTSHPEYLASNKDPRSLDYFPLLLCARALRYLSTCRRRARKEKKRGEVFLNSDQFIWDTQLGCTPGTKAPKHLCSPRANGDRDFCTWDSFGDVHRTP